MKPCLPAVTVQSWPEYLIKTVNYDKSTPATSPPPPKVNVAGKSLPIISQYQHNINFEVEGEGGGGIFIKIF